MRALVAAVHRGPRQSRRARRAARQCPAAESRARRDEVSRHGGRAADAVALIVAARWCWRWWPCGIGRLDAPRRGDASSRSTTLARWKTAAPIPDALLAHVQSEEQAARRGKLKIFFGATAGVGKTYAMLEAARRVKAEGVDVVVGYVEPHGRSETEKLLEGLEAIPHLTAAAGAGAGARVRSRSRARSASRNCCWSTSSRTPTPRAAATPSAGRTSRNCATPASMSGRRSTSSTSRA